MMQSELRVASVEYKKEPSYEVASVKETSSGKSTPELPRATTFLTSVPESMMTRNSVPASVNTSMYSIQETQEVISNIAKRFKETQELIAKASTPNVSPSGRSPNASGAETPSMAGNTSTLSYYSNRTNL
jgi:hypothetical protein